MVKKFKLKHHFTKPKKNHDLLMRMPNLYEPMRQNRYLLRILNGENSEWWVSPAYNLSVGGERTSGEFWVTFRDPIITNTNNVVDFIDDLGYNRVDMELEMLDPTGVVVEKWVLNGCVVSGMDTTNLNLYDNNAYEGLKVLFNPNSTYKIL